MSGEGADEFFGGYDRIFDWSLKISLQLTIFVHFIVIIKLIKIH